VKQGWVRAALALVLVVAAGVLAALALGDGVASRPAVATARLATPLWSVRRDPQLVLSDAAAAIDTRQVSSALDAYVSRYAQACYVVAGPDGAIATHDPDEPLLPASTEKLLTATAALEVLGPGFRYTTVALAPSAPVDGTIDQLWVVGSGDPEMATAPYAQPGVTTPLEGLADSIVASGVRRVNSGIFVDDSRYDAQRYVPTWKDTYRTQFESGPLGALTVNHGIPLVQGRPVTVDDPGLYTGSELAGLLRARGVAVGPMIARGSAPAGGATVGSVQSQPLVTILGAMLQTSDNLVAELITKELGVHVLSQGTTAAGTSVTLAQLRALGVPLDGVTMLDGSGLDRDDRITCSTLAAIADLARTPELSVLGRLLPAAGQGTPLSGEIEAKGGYLDDVIGLAGFLDAGRPLQFAFLVNGPLSPNPGDDLTGFVEALASVPAPSVTGIVPAVAPPVATGTRTYAAAAYADRRDREVSP
jgi:D-alanyl-D-alanine carboxypeptidase/D-alanyl-D-alanine-endopeptidase (penicillin-binding protein 4)